MRPQATVSFLDFSIRCLISKTCTTAFYLLNIPSIYLPSNLLHGNLFHKCISLVQRRFRDLNSFLRPRRLLCCEKSRLKYKIYINISNAASSRVTATFSFAKDDTWYSYHDSVFIFELVLFFTDVIQQNKTGDINRR